MTIPASVVRIDQVAGSSLPCANCGCSGKPKFFSTSSKEPKKGFLQCANVLCRMETAIWDSEEACLQRWNSRPVYIK